MSTLIRLLALCLLISLNCLGQFNPGDGTDPAATDKNLLPRPLTALGQVFSLSFTIGNNSPVPISGATVAERMQFNITLQDCVLEPTNTAALSGPLTDYFDLTYDPINKVIGGVQKANVAIPGVTLLQVVFAAKVTKYSTDTAVNTIGAKCDIIPNPSSGAFEPIDNDHNAIYTHTTVTAAMPVSLVAFTANAEADRTVLLEWKTSWERTNKGYVIERSKDLTRFESVGEVTDVAGSSSSINTYRFVDRSPYRGTSYYRLRQVDVDGSSQSFKAAPVVIEGRYGVYPNPVMSREFTLELDEPASAVLHLYGVNGGELGISHSALSAVSTRVKPTSKLSSGVYVLTVEERGSIRQHRLVVP